MPVRPGVVWLSTSSAEIARAREVIRALRQEGVIDELGFLMLNGAFAERFYPGVTTIMTRARYLIFIPAIYQYIEQSRLGLNRDVDRLSRDLQFALRNALKKNETSFIGKEGGRSLIRVPSSIYWNALQKLRIAQQAMSEAAYQRALAEGRFGPSVHKDDDGVAQKEEEESLWCPKLRLSHVMVDVVDDQGRTRRTFPPATSFRLRKSEAMLLEERYSQLKIGGQENLVTRMVTLARQLGTSDLSALDYPWDVPGCEKEVVEQLDHAKRLSLFARGATLQYYAMLLEKKNDSDQRVNKAFEGWWEVARRELRDWDLPRFFQLLRSWQAGRGRSDEEFIAGWSARVTAAARAEDVLVDSESRRLIAHREDTVRRGKQRLRVKHQLESWKLPNSFGGHFFMDYRHKVGRQIAMDIAEGLLGSAA
jgi:hypothetical protein